MSDILDRAKAHYQALPRREIMVPEWGDPGKPAKITWSELTVSDQERIYALGDDGRSPSGGSVRLRAVMLKACDEAGQRLFDGMAEHSLRHEVDGNVIGRIANAILYGAGLTNAKGTALGQGAQVDGAKND